MAAKWLDRASISRALALTLVAGAAQAQLVNGQWRVAPQQAGRAAVQVNAPTVFAQQGANPIVAQRQPVAFTYVPTIVMSDGTVYANYGYGYQQVVTCAPAAVTPYAAYGAGLAQTATPMQQAPNQQTRSQQMVASNHYAGSPVQQSPCGHQAPTPTAAVGRRY